MKTPIAALTTLLALSAPALAAEAPVPAPETTFKLAVVNIDWAALVKILVNQGPSKCVHYNHTACTNAELANSYYKQVVLLSAGFQDADVATWWSKFDQAVDQMTGDSAGNVWSKQERARLLFVGYYTGGGALGTPTSSFGAKVMVHPIRGWGLTLDQDSVYAKIDQIRANEVHGLNPFTAGVIMNTTQSPVTANASPPSFVRKPYGIAKFTVADVQNGPYVLTHECAHAGLNYVDEYVENGLQDQNIQSFDVLTPLLQLDGSWGGFVDAISNFFGVYSVALSETLANNGNDNVTTSRYPATVSTPGYSTPDYKYEGGMFFGHGTWHMPGANLMDDNNVTHGSDDGFAYAHSPAQQRVINLAFGDTSQIRPNDRLLNAGPVNGWPLALGSTTHVMMRDADKNHHFQPTKQYDVQVGWYDRQWHTCWAAIFPYPCYDDVWSTAQRSFTSTTRSINLKMSAAYALVSLAQQVLAEVGYCQINMAGGGKFDLCTNDISTITDAFLPTTVFDLSYQDASVPATQWMTTYYWRFATENQKVTSGYTAWSHFFRSF